MESVAWMQDARQQQQATIQRERGQITGVEEYIAKTKKKIVHNEGMLSMLEEMDDNPESEEKTGLMSEIEVSKDMLAYKEREIAQLRRKLANHEKTLATLNARLLQSEACITVCPQHRLICLAYAHNLSRLQRNLYRRPLR
jgi:methylmalonyl-CoA mutase N-terminal domain/subunit